ncbi:MAG: T9SS type A sorting domain-containing protein, partial [Bacteroidales bacterium]|nr:T9SS type A sorting domain-containing protein [Bacteroidales bacterium]
SYSEEGNTLNGCFYLEISTEPTHTYWAKSNEICIGNLGINDVESVAMTMAPNPVVRGQQVAVTVSESNLQGAVVNVYDAQGRQVMNFELRNSNFEIPTSTLVSGIYTVRIVLADGRTATKKIVVK